MTNITDSILDLEAMRDVFISCIANSNTCTVDETDVDALNRAIEHLRKARYQVQLQVTNPDAAVPSRPPKRKRILQLDDTPVVATKTVEYIERGSTERFSVGDWVGFTDSNFFGRIKSLSCTTYGDERPIRVGSGDVCADWWDVSIAPDDDTMVKLTKMEVLTRMSELEEDE